MDKVRVFEVAKELGKESKEVIQKAKEIGINIKTASTSITTEEAGILYDYIINNRAPSTPSKESKEEVKPESKKSTKSTTPKKTIVSKEKEKEEISSKVSSKRMSKQDSLKEKDESKEAKLTVVSPKTPKKTIETKEGLEISKESSTPPQETKELKETIQAPPIEIPKQEEELSPKITQGDIAPNITQRRGIRIIKKGKDKESAQADQKITETKKATAKSLQELLEGASISSDETSNFRKKEKKKEKKKQLATKKGEQHKIDLLDGREFFNNDSIEDNEENDVLLFDLSVREEHDEEEEEANKHAQVERIKTQRHNPFMEIGSVRRGGRKKSNYLDKERERERKKNEQLAIASIDVPQEIRAYEFAEKIKRNTGEVIGALFKLGMMVTKNDFLDSDAIEILAEEFGVKINVVNTTETLDYTLLYDNEITEKNAKERPPVVTIMGHVDHGKTSLLDYIRNSKVAASEAGGITQHIGAYTIEKNGKKIAFIDTPGHEAFSEMRARGAQVTDIVIVVIAADDGVKPQTIEALNHAKTAGVPIVIAMNKMDKPDANPDKLKAEASELGFTPLDWGGEYEFVPISAKSGQGVEDLLETILLQAEILDLKANPSGMAKAVVIESSLEKGRGPIATVIVQNGELKLGDSIIADTAYGRVRAIVDDLGKPIKSLYPSEVGVIVGLNEVPPAGSVLLSVANDSIARDYAEKRMAYLRQKELSRSTKVSFDELSTMVAEGKLKSLSVIIKTDTQGSLEAIRSALEKLTHEEIKINIIHSGVGGITESDVILASASANSIILGFNVRPTGNVKLKAKELGIEIKTYSVIYALIDDIKALLSGLLSPVIEEENTGQAEVREIFNVAKVGTIAGCFVSDGVIQKGIKVRLIRDGVVIHNGTISSLKRFKDDVKEVAKGFECGIMLENYNDIQVGDVFETYKEVQKIRKID